MKGAFQEVTVSMFVISDSGEMLLHQQHSNSSSSHVWGIPCFIHNDYSITSHEAAQLCLTALGLQGELYELFGREHVIIALINTDETVSISLPPDHVWRNMRHIVQDTRERPAHYSSWLKSSLEGVLLYLKTHLNDHISLKDFTRSEL
jgi:hypothetical protein